MPLIFSDAQRTTLRGLNAYRSFGAVAARPCPEDPTQAHCVPQKTTPEEQAAALAMRSRLGPPPPIGSSPDRIAAYNQAAAAYAAANTKVCKTLRYPGGSQTTCKTQAEWDGTAGQKLNIGIWGAGRGGAGGAAGPIGVPAGGGGGAGFESAPGGAGYPDAPPADAPPAADSGGGMSTLTMVLIGVGGLALAGGAYVLLSK
jgi:hypothetical protein